MKNYEKWHDLASCLKSYYFGKWVQHCRIPTYGPGWAWAIVIRIRTGLGWAWACTWAWSGLGWGLVGPWGTLVNVLSLMCPHIWSKINRLPPGPRFINQFRNLRQFSFSFFFLGYEWSEYMFIFLFIFLLSRFLQIHQISMLQLSQVALKKHWKLAWNTKSRYETRPRLQKLKK